MTTPARRRIVNRSAAARFRASTREGRKLEEDNDENGQHNRADGHNLQSLRRFGQSYSDRSEARTGPGSPPSRPEQTREPCDQQRE